MCLQKYNSGSAYLIYYLDLIRVLFEISIVQIKKLPTQKHYTNKIIRNALVGFIVIIVSLFMGMAGYHYFFNLVPSPLWCFL